MSSETSVTLRVQTRQDATHHVIRLTNDGSVPLTIVDIELKRTLGSSFRLSPPSLPLALAPGHHEGVEVLSREGFAAETNELRVEVEELVQLHRVELHRVVEHVNQCPTASITPQQDVPKKGERIQLDGRASHDPDGHVASYFWQLVSHPIIPSNRIFGERTSRASIQAFASGTYVFELTVYDEEGLRSCNTARESITIR